MACDIEQVPLSVVMDTVADNHDIMKAACYTSDESEAVCEVRWRQYQNQLEVVNKELWKLWVLQKQNMDLSEMNNEIKNLLK